MRRARLQPPPLPPPERVEVNRVLLVGRTDGGVQFTGTDKWGRPYRLTRFGVYTAAAYHIPGGETMRPEERHPCVAWGLLSDQAVDLRPGDDVYVDGRLYTDWWKSSETDQIRYKTVVVALEIIRHPSKEIIMAAYSSNRQIAARVSNEEHLKANQFALRQGLTMSEYIRQQIGLDPFTRIYVRLPTLNGEAWRLDWTPIDEDNLDGTYTMRKGEPPIPWEDGQPFAVWVNEKIPDHAVRHWHLAEAQRRWGQAPQPPVSGG